MKFIYATKKGEQQIKLFQKNIFTKKDINESSYIVMSG